MLEMLEKFSILINLLTIILIIIQMPKGSIGLIFGNNDKNVLLSITKGENLAKTLTVIGILGHIFLAYKLDINI